MIFYPTIQQGTDEWFKVRLLKFTASNASAIIANGAGLETLINNMLSDYYHYLEFGDFPPKFKNDLMQRGNDLEDIARKVYQIETNQTVAQVGFVKKSEYVGCSPDGLIGSAGLVEIKNHSDEVFYKLLTTKKINKKYLDQIQMQLYVTERKWCDYFGFNNNFDVNYVKIRIKPDQKIFDKLEKNLKIATKKLLEKKETLDKLFGVWYDN